jgi:hypothetical protein
LTLLPHRIICIILWIQDFIDPIAETALHREMIAGIL